MKESLRAQLDRMQNRLEELNAQLASEDIGKDISLLKKLNQEHAETSEVLDTYALWKQAGADLEAARQMREEPSSPRRSSFSSRGGDGPASPGPGQSFRPNKHFRLRSERKRNS